MPIKFRGGSPVLDGDAAESDVTVGKTFYSNDVKTKKTGNKLYNIYSPLKTSINCVVVPSGGGDAIVNQTQVSTGATRNLYNTLFGNILQLYTASDTTFGAGHVNLKDTDGTVRQYYHVGSYYNAFEDKGATCGGAGTDTQKGIHTGTGTTAQSFEDYKLAARITHGTSAGLLSFSAETISDQSYNVGTRTMTGTRTRTFANASGADITVGEVGYSLQFKNGSSTFIGYALMDRTVLSTPIVVPNGYSLVVTYTFETQYPA